MSISYPDRALITRNATGTQDPNTGHWTEGNRALIYDGAADVQTEGRALRRAIDGDPDGNINAVMFIEETIFVPTVKPEDDVEVTFEDGVKMQGKVRSVSRLGDVISMYGMANA